MSAADLDPASDLVPAPARPRRGARATVSLGLVLVCVIGTMALGAAVKSPCASGSWSDGRQYTWLCYSDIVPLLDTEQLFDGGQRLPFLDACEAREGQNCDEYPVVTMYFIRLAGWISGNHHSGFYVVNALMLLGCAVAIAVCLYVLNGARALYFALAPTLLIYGTMNWDLLAVLFATVAMVLFFRRRDTGAGAALGLGAAVKFYPMLLALPLILQRMRDRSPDRAIAIGWSTAGAWLLVNLPFAVVALSAWFTFFRFNSQRPADFDSSWYLACEHLGRCFSVKTINLASLAMFGLSFCVVWAIKARRHPTFAPWTLGFPLIVLFLLTSKVYSPQYGLWLLPWFALALPRMREFVAFELADIAVFVTRFWFFGDLTGGFGVPQGAFEIAVVFRSLVLVWCVVAWIRRTTDPLEIEVRTVPVDQMQPA
ncbi:MAG: glycosyltransferase family 87 protein [Myxococcota bacterium]